MFKIPDTIGCTFQNLYFIVEAFCGSIGDMGIFEGVQYLFAPMSVGFGTLLEFRKLRLFGCRDPFKEFFPLFGILWVLTDSIKPFFEIVGKPQIVVVKKHQITSFFIVVLEFSITCEYEGATPFVVLAEICRHCFLQSFSNVLDGPGSLSDKVVFINNNGGVWKECLCQVCIRTPHVTDEELDPVPLLFRDIPEVRG